MMRLIVFIFIVGFFSLGNLFGQTQEIKLDPVKVEKYLPYIKYKHSWEGDFETWKSNHKLLYTQEMWYFSESFYIKRDHFPDGGVLNEDIIYISRYESQRKENEEVIIKLPGFKDALVLIPGNKLLYKAN